jgi:rubredoxin
VAIDRTTDTYACARCGGTFEKGWSDDEAEAETRRMFGNVPDHLLSVVCDDCFKALKATRRASGRPLPRWS